MIKGYLANLRRKSVLAAFKALLPHAVTEIVFKQRELFRGYF